MSEQGRPDSISNAPRSSQASQVFALRALLQFSCICSRQCTRTSWVVQLRLDYGSSSATSAPARALHEMASYVESAGGETSWTTLRESGHFGKPAWVLALNLSLRTATGLVIGMMYPDHRVWPRMTSLHTACSASPWPRSHPLRRRLFVQSKATSRR
ncbi:hypothetical protein OE88DRAFT_1660111 [Heliocybe sulcata]|uniref:Uncharacterized protein n=1 Tax=Heliocybe sulcata TaxID=5364 RepID=A0A5C3N035_9AGAM|nr:hypothetical protein OE88DRAFT_1660111 [Heliocybe sulcata]